MAQKKYKILLIDDDPFILDMYALKFKELGYDLEIAQDGKKGLVKIKTFVPDVVLLDVIMPVTDGFTVMQEIAKTKLNPRPKIIILTNLGQKEDIERGMQLGADDYIIKAHFTPSEVAEKIKEVLKK